MCSTVAIKTENEPVEQSSDEEYDFSNDPDQFSCTLCTSSFVTRASLARHMILHEHQKQMVNFICSFCNTGFNQRETLASHISNDHGGAKFICPQCDRNFSRRDHLLRHVRNVHPLDDLKTEDEEYEADDSMQSNEDGYPTALDQDDDDDEDEADMMVPVIDMGEHHDLPHMSQNGRGYDHEDDSSHVDVSPDEDRDQQTEGDDHYEEEGEYDPIVKINASLNGIRVERKHQCEECGVSFLNRVNLARHMTTHSVNRPHKCPMCGKGFVRKEHLTKHLSSVHSGMKFTCNFCGKDISRKDHLIRHIRNVHPAEYLGIPNELPLNLLPEAYSSSLDKAIQSLTPKPKKPYLTCDMCDARFTNLTLLHEHQSTTHSDVRRFKCDFCPKAFKRKEHLTKHIVLHTGEKAFPCLRCGKEFPRKDALQDHIRRIHGSSDTMTMEFPCNFCDKVFLQRPNLLRHMKNNHGLIVNIPMESMDYEGSSNGLHNSSAHDQSDGYFPFEDHVSFNDDVKALVKSIGCAHCTASFSNETEFKLHLLSQHTF